MFLSENEEKNQIKELNPYKVNITNYNIEFSKQNSHIKIPLNNILYSDQRIFFKIRELSLQLNKFYQNKFKIIIEKIQEYSKNNRFLYENGYIIFTSYKLKTKNSYYYTTHNAILLSSNQEDYINLSKSNLDFILKKIEENYSIFISNNKHILENQNFDSTYKFNLNWKSELIHKNELIHQNHQNDHDSNCYISLNKEGIYITKNQVF